MLELYGEDYVLRNLYKLGKVIDPNLIVRDAQDIKAGYIEFLKGTQFSSNPDIIKDLFVVTKSSIEGFSDIFSQGALNDLNQADVIGDQYVDRDLAAKVTQASRSLNKLFSLDDSISAIFGISIHSIVIRASKSVEGRPTSHGGSSSSSIGVIWLSVADAVEDIDLIEMFIHELTHHLLFIDELNNPQFNYANISLKDNYARSAILKRQRPLDKVVHSIVVGAEVLQARGRYLGRNSSTLIHPDSQTLATDIVNSVASVRNLKNLDDLITPHVREILRRCSSVAEAHGGSNAGI